MLTPILLMNAILPGMIEREMGTRAQYHVGLGEISDLLSLGFPTLLAMA